MDREKRQTNCILNISKKTKDVNGFFYLAVYIQSNCIFVFFFFIGKAFFFWQVNTALCTQTLEIRRLNDGTMYDMRRCLCMYIRKCIVLFCLARDRVGHAACVRPHKVLYSIHIRTQTNGEWGDTVHFGMENIKRYKKTHWKSDKHNAEW